MDSHYKSKQTVPRVGLGVFIYDKKSEKILVSKRKDTNLYALPGNKYIESKILKLI